MSNEFNTDEWMDANHRLLQVWTQQTQRWMEQMMTGDPTAIERPPMFEDLMGLSGKLIALGDSFGELVREIWQYQAFFTPAVFQMWQSYLIEKAAANSDHPNFESAVNNWFDYANTEMLQLQNSEEYLAASQRLGQAISRFKTCQRKVSDYLLSRMDMPTQAEMDSLGRTLFDLKREVRRLKEEIRSLKEKDRKQKAANDEPSTTTAVTEQKVS